MSYGEAKQYPVSSLFSRFMKKPDEIRRNRGLALRFRAQQRKETTLQNSLSQPMSPSSPNAELAKDLEKHETKMNTSSCPASPANGIISYVHLNETKPSIGQSLELKNGGSKSAVGVQDIAKVSPPSSQSYNNCGDRHLCFSDSQKERHSNA
jgi:hypothetical protein